MKKNIVIDTEFLEYSTYKDAKDWKDNNWPRMWRFEGKFNQVEQAIKRLKAGENSKTISIVVNHPIYDGKLTMGMPCLYAINLAPRNGNLYLNADWRSNAISKSGFCDLTAVNELGTWLCKQTGLTFVEQTSYIHSCHIRSVNDERKKVIKIVEMYSEVIF